MYLAILSASSLHVYLIIIIKILYSSVRIFKNEIRLNTIKWIYYYYN